MNNSGFTQAELQQMQALLSSEIKHLTNVKRVARWYMKWFSSQDTESSKCSRKRADTVQAKINKLAKLQYKVKKLQKTSIENDYAILGYVSDDGLFTTRLGRVTGGPVREWTTVYKKEN